MTVQRTPEVRKVPTYCYQCVAGPDLLTVRVEDGVATEVEPNFTAADIHPASGRVCVKAFGLIHKLHNPNRVLAPMKRTNPKKGRGEDPGFVPVSWDEALDTIAAKLREAMGKGLVDESGFPRVAASFGGGGTPTYYLGTFPAFLSALKVIDFSFGSGQGVKCYHSEHLYGEFWHRAFTVAADTPHCDYVVSFGSNVEASSGSCGVWRHADARVRGIKRVQVEPHLSVTGAASAEWVPIKPKTDPAFMFAMIHVLVNEHPVTDLDVPFLKHHTAAPYLIGPNGFYLRDPATRKPLMWDERVGAAVPFDAADADPALLGGFTVENCVEVGPDEQVWTHESVTGETAHSKLVAHMKPHTPEWASAICEVPADTIRRVAEDFLAHARIGETVEIEGRTLPYRPVAVTLGKTVTNGWGGYECCWSRTLLSCLVGGLEVPGGTLGTTVRLNRPATSRQASCVPGPDGFMNYPMNPTDKENWHREPKSRSGYSTLVPLVANSAWSQALGPTHLAWMFQKAPPEGWPKPTYPDVWFLYRTNPAISFWDTDQLTDTMTKFPFMVAFAYTHDESNHMADVLLPDAMDLESTQLIRIGGTKFIEQFWDYQGFALRQPVAEPRGDCRDFTWIATELAKRTGVLEGYNKAINRGAAGVELSFGNCNFALEEDKEHSVQDIWNAICRAASAELSGGEETQGLDWWKENGFRVQPMSRLDWYLFPTMQDQGLRFELPYQERLTRIGQELANRMHENGMHWWDTQLDEYQPFPVYHDVPAVWSKVLTKIGKDPADYPFWLLTARSMQYAWGGNVGVQMIREVAENVAGHKGVIINAQTAERLGIEEGDVIEVASHLAKVQGQAFPRQGIRPDTLLMIGQFGHWKTPLAKDFDTPSMNALTPMELDLTDSTGSGADLVRVSIRKVKGGRR